MSDRIDTNFDFYTESNGNDPDPRSKTLQRYHSLLWSKPLPNGEMFTLEPISPQRRLKHSSDLGEFILSSDSITHSYSKTVRMKKIVEKVPETKVANFFRKASTIGGYIVFPVNKVKEEQSINQARGCNSKVIDRFDITLECIRRFYYRERSILTDVLARHSDFFRLFGNFKGYVDFFLLQDLVSDDYRGVEYFIPVNTSPLPRDVGEYHKYMMNSISFIDKRNGRIERWAEENL